MSSTSSISSTLRNCIRVNPNPITIDDQYEALFNSIENLLNRNCLINIDITNRFSETITNDSSSNIIYLEKIFIQKIIMLSINIIFLLVSIICTIKILKY